MAVKDTYARKSLRYNFSPTLADHPGIFHAKLPSAGASQLVLAPPPPLTVPPLILPLFLSTIRRRDALSSLLRTCHARGSKLPKSKATRENIHPVLDSAGGKNARRKDSTVAVYLPAREGGREGTADGRSRSSRRRGDGYSYSMKNRRPFTLRLTPNG